MNSVNKTLYIPLYGKACVSKKGLFLDDKKAEEIWETEGFALKGKSKSKWLAGGCISTCTNLAQTYNS